MSEPVKKRASSPGYSRLLRTLEQLLGLPASDLRAALVQASDVVARALHAERVDVYLYDATRESLVRTAAGHAIADPTQHDPESAPLLLSAGGRLVEVLQTGAPYFSHDASQDAAVPAALTKELQIRSLIVVPLEINGTRQGLLTSASKQTKQFSNTDLRFLAAVGRWIGLIAQQAILLEQQTAATAEQERRGTAEEMITVLAHDLGNYLTTLQGRLDLLEIRSTREGRERDARDAAALNLVVRRLHRLTGNLLDVSKLDQGVFSLSPAPFDLAATIRTCADLLRSAATEILVEVPETLPIVGDPDRIQQAIENVITNAIRHGDSSKPIQVTTESLVLNGRTAVAVNIHNFGPNIPAEVLAQLFKPFSPGPQSAGFGLGLYLARGIAEAHGGAISVTSTPEEGTRFRMVIPVAPSPG